MSSPRHLWSGDWEKHSAASAEELAARRAQDDDAPEAPAGPDAPRPAGPSAAERAAAGFRSGRERLAGLDARERLRRAVARARPAPSTLGPAPRPAPRAPDPVPGPAIPPPPLTPAAAPHTPAAAPRTPRSRPASRRTRRSLPLALLVALAALLSAGLAYGVVTAVTNNGQASATESGPAWLGIDTLNSPFGSGVIVTFVAPGSPADHAGLVPGDVITAIGSRQVQAPGDVDAALAGLHAGDRIAIQIEQGLTPFTLHATLSARPAGYP